MDDTFKWLFGRGLSDDEEETDKKPAEFRPVDGFNPTDRNYDPQVRLKRRLKAMFPHLLGIPGVPPSTMEDSDNR